tara:strand:- start:234 stop:449 length:216 start_codon:yes stop_codon:yes gene_type:complete
MVKIMSNSSPLSFGFLAFGVGLGLGILFTLVAQNRTEEPISEVRDKADLITILLLSIFGIVSIILGVEIFG